MKRTEKTAACPDTGQAAQHEIAQHQPLYCPSWCAGGHLSEPPTGEFEHFSEFRYLQLLDRSYDEFFATALEQSVDLDRNRRTSVQIVVATSLGEVCVSPREARLMAQALLTAAEEAEGLLPPPEGRSGR
jgi:hypothetical protein